jgi:alcohol dehydrogenase class IV
VARAAASTRTPILLSDGGSSEVAPFVARHLGASPGERCLVLSPAGGNRATPITHYLRRGGFFPLPLELPDSTPAAQHVAAAAAAARRVGAAFVVGVGSAATLSVARATAAILPNGGAVADYAGGAGVLRAPSLPLLCVPTCPGGAELLREALLISEGPSLVSVRAHAESLQAALIDPRLAAGLRGRAALATACATLAHAVEAYVRQDGARDARELAWFAVELSARSLVGACRGGGGGEGARAAQALASALVSASLAAGPLGPARGAALAVATRYSAGYSAALAAVAPAVCGGLAGAALGAYEEAAEAAEARAEAGGGDDGGEMEWSEGKGGAGQRDGGAWGGARGAYMFGGRRRGAAPPRAPPTRKPDAPPASGGGPEAHDEDTALLEKIFAGMSEEAAARARSGGSAAAVVRVPGEAPLSDEDEDSEVVQCARRFSHVAALLGGEVGALGAPTLPPWAPLDHVEAVARLDEAGRRGTAQLGARMRRLAATAAAAAGEPAPPALEDFALTDADLQAVAAMAEVDENTLNTNFTQLKQRDILAMLKEAV